MTPKRTSTHKAAGAAVATRTGASAPLAAGEAGEGGLVIEGYVRITISDKHFELRGTVGEHVKVAWHKPFEEGVDLGTATQMAGAVAGALGVANPEAFTKQLNEKLDSVKNLPIVGGFAKIVEEAPVKVTDLGIDTLVGRYQFGFGWDLSGMGAGYQGITLDAFGLVFTYTKTQEAE